MPDPDADPTTAPPGFSRPAEAAAVHLPTPQKISARLIVLLGALTAFSPLAIDMYLPAFPQIQRDLAAPPGTLQLTLSLFLAGLSIGQFVVGPISDRTGRRLPLLAGCSAFAVAAILCTLAPSVGWLMTARFLMGFAGAAGLVVSRAVVRDLFDETRSAGVYSFISGSPTIFMELYGVSPQAFSVFFAGNAIGLFLAAQLNRRLLPHLGPRRILRGASTVAAVAGLLLLIEAWSGIGGFSLFYATLFLCVATLGLIFPNATAAAMAPFGREAGAASAVLGLLQYAVGAAAGAAVGLLHNGTAIPMAGAVAACEICVWLVVLDSERRRS